MNKDQFMQGFVWENYLTHLDENLEELKKERDEAEEFVKAWREMYDRVLISDEARETIKSINKRINVIALAEYWCSDARANLPVMVHISKINPNIQLRIFPRDSNLELMKNYLFRGKSMSIPAFGFFDENFNEFAKWLGGKPKWAWDKIEELGKEAANQLIRDFNIENRGQETLKEFLEILKQK